LVKVKCFTYQEFKPSEGLKPSDGSKLKYLSMKIGTLLNSYSQAFNKMYNRHGNLFQQKTNAKPIPDNRYLLSLLTYIHQNPVRSKLVEKPHQWIYSSYLDYIDLRTGTLPRKGIIFQLIPKNELQELTESELLNL
jgi:hypothetical protein